MNRRMKARRGLSAVLALQFAAAGACDTPARESSDWDSLRGGSNPQSGESLKEDDFIVPSEGVGSIGGELTVLPNGEAAYSVNFRLPPGRGGLTPSLGLRYASSGGTRELGKGWALSGLSAISRCPGKIWSSEMSVPEASWGVLFGYLGNFPDSLIPDDYHTLCFNGQLMLPVDEDGAEYRVSGSPRVKVELPPKNRTRSQLA